MQQKASIATDLTHNQGVFGCPVVNISHVVPAPVCVEFPVQMNHLGPVNGFAGKHSLADRVFHKGQSVVRQFHDCGYLITHISPVGDAVVGTAQSSRVVVFGAGLVRVQSAPVGFAIFADPSTPMLTCGKYPLPVAEAKRAGLNSVVVGMDPNWDHQCGWDHIGLLILKAGVAQVIEGIVMFVTIGAGSLAVAAEKAIVDTGQGLVESFGIDVLKQVAGDSIESTDIGRRYQERMQRRRRAGQDFGSERRGELARGGAEGVGEAVYGPVGDVLGGPASDYLFGTGPEEPEY